MSAAIASLRLTESAVREIVRNELSAAELEIPDDQLQVAVDKLLASKPAPGGLDEDAVKALIRAALKAFKPKPAGIEVRLPDASVRVIEGHTHAAFPRVLALAAARRNILLVGPAGSGKSHIGEQIAAALGFTFHGAISLSGGAGESALVGRFLPIGENGRFELQDRPFTRAYEQGGVVVLDEIDASDSTVTLCLNSALANGHFTLPNGRRLTRHPDFICIATANTWGTGADRAYVGRNHLDESTLDRFRIGQVEMDYDADLEAAFCPDSALRTRLQGYRQRIRTCKLRRIVSSRFIREAYVMLTTGWNAEDIDAALFAGWSADEVAKVKGA